MIVTAGLSLGFAVLAVIFGFLYNRETNKRYPDRDRIVALDTLGITCAYLGLASVLTLIVWVFCVHA